MTADIKLPSPVTLPTLGLPAALLISRPDVQAAQARVRIRCAGFGSIGGSITQFSSLW